VGPPTEPQVSVLADLVPFPPSPWGGGGGKIEYNCLIRQIHMRSKLQNKYIVIFIIKTKLNGDDGQENLCKISVT
jgi:hypothetical protein